MNNNIKKILKPARRIKLEKEIKASIKGGVLMFMKNNPLTETPKFGFWKIIFSQKLKPAYISILSLVAVLLVSGAVSAQASLALPGDILYPVKVGVNEKVLQVLAFSDQAKIKLSVRLAETRLKEAEKLVVENRITKDNQMQINNNFSAKADEVSKSINKLNREKMENSAQKIADDFNKTLEIHTKVLEKIQQEKDKSDKARDKNRENVDSIINRVNSVRDKINADIKENKIKNEKKAEEIRQKANEQIQKIKDKIESNKAENNTENNIENNTEK
ncbi:MAG: hypothetical protein A2528_01870 [Candidatus Staskawiczbacteria bacterium RIFOXYD2_FULL_37_9]|uniref:DUF5667 domain-containing protein n=1 Tax=Candidatus Staskawiczbacteria bacterium RIFOXYB1_FULL_37_44 TaxID=1802223 RepID=A0A1G2IZ04_9BACT|nr:MAG: hypothetical protein A2358_01295 [Candidatus Staskawiczbacteria bacterium RIFOXYB1_FULL_37_44]OGZ83341.1 MAG: hypothetical protein A2416_02030 [Candidatus Staskawiczbacteria bacterium RIFOXYC1_FULL_37_52]OGZ88744.1 MAG: hypothetical protein A2581_02970 [Candidatus Staskawiczbacteria bacterium RIFOXYD1_FULL_37_110]OGZ89494.1 MAG: hypothetical protein A2444_03035 [Candidatus Staskawiczbacteria bacterium RIFOXYC2_FULL_37_19]OGZ93571.1 MAG: hypothetical protein A2528_01870 [Candidatus Stask